MRFPAAVPEVPVKDSAKAVAHYVDVLGFVVDCHDEESGIAGVSRGDCRLFLTHGNFRRTYGNKAPALIWLNLENKDEVDESCTLHSRGSRPEATRPSVSLIESWSGPACRSTSAIWTMLSGNTPFRTGSSAKIEQRRVTEVVSAFEVDPFTNQLRMFLKQSRESG